MSPRSVDDTKKNENHFVVISLTDKSKATSDEKKVNMKEAPLVGKLGSTEISKSLKIQRLFPENPLRAYFTKYVGILGGLDFDQGVFEY